MGVSRMARLTLRGLGLRDCFGRHLRNLLRWVASYSFLERKPFLLVDIDISMPY